MLPLSNRENAWRMRAVKKWSFRTVLTLHVSLTTRRGHAKRRCQYTGTGRAWATV